VSSPISDAKGRTPRGGRGGAGGGLGWGWWVVGVGHSSVSTGGQYCICAECVSCLVLGCIGVLGWFGVIDAVQFVDVVLIMSNVVLCGSV